MAIFRLSCSSCKEIREKDHFKNRQPECNWLVSEFNPPQLRGGDGANSKYTKKY